MLALRTALGVGYSPTATSEWQYDIGSVRATSGVKPGLIYCHGSGDTATTILAKTGQAELLRQLGQHFMVCAADLGGQVWGNDTHIARVGEAVAYVKARYGVSGKVTIVTGSMGTLGGLGYALAHPENVQAVAAIIPALDLTQLVNVAGAEINAAYGGTYSNTTHGPTHNPVVYADDLDASLPIHLFTASDDTITLPSSATAFVAARPQTMRADLGALGHSEAAVVAAVPKVVAWLKGVQ